MILADESLDLIIIEALQRHNIELYAIFELNRGLSDEEIIELSRNPPRIILNLPTSMSRKEMVGASGG